MRFLLIQITSILFLITNSVSAQDILTVKNDMVIICSAFTLDTPPSFTSKTCEQKLYWSVDTHKNTIWVSGTFILHNDTLHDQSPLGLFLSTKSASKVYINNRFLGQNGIVGKNNIQETPGKLDTVFFVPKSFLRPGSNKVSLLLSGHHSLIPNSHTLHRFEIGPYLQPKYRLLNNYWPSLLTFGVFIVGAIYFGYLAFVHHKNLSVFSLAVASLFAAFQLLTEVMRGIWAYPYPLHDVRLTLIILFSLGVGFALASHTFERFQQKGQISYLIGLLIITIAVLYFAPDFDKKTAWAILVPSISALAVAVYAAYNRIPYARHYTVAFIIFSGLNIAAPGEFLDTNYYFALMVLMLYLFAQQAQTLRKSEINHTEAENRRQKLEMALAKLINTEITYISVISAGKKERIATSEVSVFSGAGDYVTLHLVCGKELLHSTSLAALEEELPSYFLRVHRSHIVNSNHIKELSRLPSGTGELILQNGTTIPVSRRIMPHVRSALS